MYLIRNLHLYILILLSFSSLILSSIRFDSYKLQNTLISDLSNNEFSLNIDEIQELNSFYPSLFFNTISISTVLSRYYFDMNDYKNALEYGFLGLESNPYLAYTNYFVSRIYIRKNELKLSKIYLEKAYNLSPNIEEIKVLYFNLLNILENQLNE